MLISFLSRRTLRPSSLHCSVPAVCSFVWGCGPSNGCHVLCHDDAVCLLHVAGRELLLLVLRLLCACIVVCPGDLQGRRLVAATCPVHGPRPPPLSPEPRGREAELAVHTTAPQQSSPGLVICSARSAGARMHGWTDAQGRSGRRGAARSREARVGRESPSGRMAAGLGRGRGRGAKRARPAHAHARRRAAGRVLDGAQRPRTPTHARSPRPGPTRHWPRDDGWADGRAHHPPRACPSAAPRRIRASSGALSAADHANQGVHICVSRCKR